MPSNHWHRRRECVNGKSRGQDGFEGRHSLVVEWALLHFNKVRMAQGTETHTHLCKGHRGWAISQAYLNEQCQGKEEKILLINKKTNKRLCTVISCSKLTAYICSRVFCFVLFSFFVAPLPPVLTLYQECHFTALFVPSVEKYLCWLEEMERWWFYNSSSSPSLGWSSKEISLLCSSLSPESTS